MSDTELTAYAIAHGPPILSEKNRLILRNDIEAYGKQQRDQASSDLRKHEIELTYKLGAKEAREALLEMVTGLEAGSSDNRAQAAYWVVKTLLESKLDE